MFRPGGAALALLLLALGCSRAFPPPAAAPPLALPTKDDVALVNGRPLTINAFRWVRSLVRKDRSPGNVFWIGTAALALATDRAPAPDALPSRESLEVALYAAGELPLDAALRSLAAILPDLGARPSPESVRARLDALLARAAVQKNAQLLAELR
jgi:hypothetical protein